MALSRWSWEQGVRSDYAQRKRAAYNQRDERTRDISLAWKSGFAKLKAENDGMQNERDVELKSTLAEIESWFRSVMAAGPPG